MTCVYNTAFIFQRLIYFESTPNVAAAIAREKQINGWIRAKKIALIGSQYPVWANLSADWEEGAH